jgi:hypothetical protein
MDPINDQLIDSMRQTIINQLEILEHDDAISSKDRIDLVHKLMPYIVPKMASVRQELSDEEKFRNDPMAKFLN